MGISVWCLIASLCLTSIKGEIYDNVAAKTYYEKPESSSPAPLPQGAIPLPGMKEYILYLTHDQVQELQSSGAIVQALTPMEQAYLQQQNQLRAQQAQQDSSNKDAKKESEIEEYYKQLNIQQINEGLGVQQKPIEKITEKPQPKYKYTIKSRFQDYSSLYLQKKANKTKSYSTEYIRYLPNFEFENLKMEPYRPQPLPGYHFENIPPQTFLQTAAPAIYQPEAIKRPEEIKPIHEPTLEDPIRSLNIKPAQNQYSVDSSVQLQSTLQETRPQTFDGKIWQTVKIQEPQIQAPLDIQTSSELQIPKKSTPIPVPVLVQSQNHFASLLAPLLQHGKITESITEQKEELINTETAIKNKLQGLKESGNSDELRFAIELDKLNKNLVKQNALAQKQALEAVAKKSQTAKDVLNLKRRRPIDIINQNKAAVPVPVLAPAPENLELKSPATYSVPLPSIRPIPVPVLQTERPIPIPVYYNKAEKPFFLHNPLPTEAKLQLPVKYSVQQPDALTLVRHIWDH